MNLHPDIAAFTGRSAPSPSILETDTATYRAWVNSAMAAAPRYDVPLSSVEDGLIELDGRSLNCRIFRPMGVGPFPIVVHYHSGGWVIGDLNMSDAVCRGLSSGAGVIVVSIDYRLAPEHRYPAAHNDAWDALNWVSMHCAELGGDGRLVVAGDSAGANLSASMTLRARPNGPAIAAQVLLYPSPAYPDPETESFKEFADGPLLTTAEAIFFWDTYLPDASYRTNPDIAPVNALDLSNLPPAFVATAECDPSRDSGEAYAKLLTNAGVPTLARRYAGMPHGFFNYMPFVPATRAPMHEVCTWLCSQLN